MVGAIGVGFLNGIFGISDVIKVREDLEEFVNVPDAETPLESISETPIVQVT